MRRNRRLSERPPRFRRVAPWVLSFFALMLLAAAGWVHFRFGPVSFEQIVANLPIGGGEGVGNSNLAIEAALECVGLPLVIVGLVASGLRLRPGRLGCSVRHRERRRPVLVVPALAFATSLGVLLAVTGVPQDASALLSDRSFAPYYVPPQVTSIPERPRNLVTIYLESGENTFSDESLFGQNLLADLDDATQDWASYPGLQQYPGGGWTMAGLVGTQCGIPLRSKLLTPGVNPNVFGEQVTNFLPGAKCLGDILADSGYTNVFLGGAHTRFAGKDTFLAGHGYDEVKGLTDWEAAGEDRSNISVWGLSDHRLFTNAQDTIADLHAAGSPFNLTLLTLDTHEPGGVFPTCVTDDEVAMATAIKCSMRAVADFIGYLEDQGFLKDTVVMVMGDHLKATSEGGSFKTELESTSERTTVFRVWSPDPVAFNRARADQFSVLPTTLDLLGFGLENGRAGLGVSFAAGYDVEGTALKLPADDYESIVSSPSSALYSEFWQEHS